MLDLPPERCPTATRGQNPLYGTAQFYTYQKKIDLIFQSRFRFTAIVARRYRGFTYSPCPPSTASPITPTPHQSGTFVYNRWTYLALSLSSKHTYVHTHIYFYTTRLLTLITSSLSSAFPFEPAPPPASPSHWARAPGEKKTLNYFYFKN